MSPLTARLGVIGAGISAIILIALLLLEGNSTQQPDVETNDITELVGPADLDGRTEAAGGLMDPNLSVELAEGGWLQIAGPDGSLSQQYRFSKLDPDPPDLPTNWITLQDPNVELFMSGGRLVTLEGEEADAYAPRRALEEGRLIGNVIIRMFDSVGGGYADPAHQTPSLTIRTTAASFDNLSGRISCKGDLTVETNTEEMAGSGLRIMLNDLDDRIEYLEITELEYLLIRQSKNDQPIAIGPRGPRPIENHASRLRTVSSTDKQTTFYRLILHDDVRIEQPPPAGVDPLLPRVVLADALHAIFSFQSSAFEGSSLTSAPTGPLSLLTTTALGWAPPRPEPDEILVTCSGPLTMAPLENPDDAPAEPGDMRVELMGDPVRVVDTAEAVSAECDLLIWRSRTERIDLHADVEDGVRIRTPEMQIDSQQAWVQPEAGFGGIEGAGLATLSPANSEVSNPNTIVWNKRVDLRFGTSGVAEGNLESIRFQGDVDVATEDGNMRGEDLDMRFVQSPDGSAVPDRLIGAGGIRAESDGQIIWAKDILATLNSAEIDDTDDKKIELRDIVATGDVEVRLADDTRIWADRLVGDAAQESVELIGSDVIIQRDQVVIGQGTSVKVNRLRGEATWANSGRAVMLHASSSLPVNTRMPRPNIPDVLDAQDSSVTWRNGAHISFDPNAEEQDAAVRSITFHEDVTVSSPDGELTSDTLTMHFAPGPDGKATPESLKCQGRVRAHSDGQTLWSDMLHATMEPNTQTRPDDAESPLAAIDLRDIDASGDVQILMKDGGRVFADQLEGDAAQETVNLYGEDVIIARDDVILDRGSNVRVDRLNGTADWIGSGRSRLLKQPLSLTTDVRVAPPRIVGSPGDPTVTMRTTWSESLHYDSLFAEGAGAMDIAGDVDCVVDRSDTQRSSLQGQSIRLEFHTPEHAPVNAPSEDPIIGSSRVLHQLIAKDDARLESRAWPTAAREETSQVFYVGAEHITWNDLTTEAVVIGDGEIVMREPDWARSSESGAPFSGPGSSQFVWEERLDLSREADDRFVLSMRGNVEGLWRSSNDSRDFASIAAEEIHLRSKRTDTEEVRQDTPLQLGGDMDIERLRAVGRVYLRTATRRVDCHMLEYNTRTGIAELVARAGRVVSLMTEGSTMPVQATRMIWNMDPSIDTITLEHPRGGGGQ